MRRVLGGGKARSAGYCAMLKRATSTKCALDLCCGSQGGLVKGEGMRGNDSARRFGFHAVET